MRQLLLFIYGSKWFKQASYSEQQEVINVIGKVIYVIVEVIKIIVPWILACLAVVVVYYISRFFYKLIFDKEFYQSLKSNIENFIDGISPNLGDFKPSEDEKKESDKFYSTIFSAFFSTQYAKKTNKKDGVDLRNLRLKK